MKRGMTGIPRANRAAGALWALVALAFAAYIAHLALRTGPKWLFDDILYSALMGSAAVACLARAALVEHERRAWAIMGAGLASWTAGEVYWAAVLSRQAEVPVPSPADALYLLYYVAAYVTLVLLLRQRMEAFRSSLWLDGAIAAFGVAACVGAVAFEPIVEATSGDPLAVAVNLSYPIGDLLLLSLVVAIFGLSGWRPGRKWFFIGAGLGLSAVADGVYLFQSANGSYVEGTLLDGIWPAAALLVGLAAWQRVESRARPHVEGWRVVVVPSACGLVAIGLLTLDHYSPIHGAAVVLAALTVVLVTVRMALVFRENLAMLEEHRTEALTDALTGLRNRRSLMLDLDRELPLATVEEPRVLILFDLDGFKQYNDAFGHLAGDGLLSRFGERLRCTVRGHGRAYRLGGDEFCVLVEPDAAGPDPLVAACCSALSDHGEGFEITASHGAVSVPVEAESPTEALQLADRRMYARKGGHRMSARRQSRDVLLSTLSERQPDLRHHLHEVAELALAVGRELGMNPEELDELARAAELRDLGKIAIPDAILSKPGALNEAEWAFMRRHTVVGERILLSAPALRPVARLVRSSHERFDGSGYPDGLAGEDIPLGARIVAVCDAYEAMTSDRPYRPPMSPEEAIAELGACAGSQFDPAVVDAFLRTLAERREPSVSPAA
jgi:diguanylate cyclase (GGDEF)-like protein